MKLIGKKIKLKRIENELTQAQLATECNIAIGTLSGIEKHSKAPNSNTLLKIASVLGVKLDELLGD